MKRYWLFSYSQYYPAGGLEDLLGTYDNADVAKTVMAEMYASLGGGRKVENYDPYECNEVWYMWDSHNDVVVDSHDGHSGTKTISLTGMNIEQIKNRR